MSKKKPLVILIILMSFLLVFQACKKKSDREQEVTPVSPAGDLKITFSSPQGKTESPHESEAVVVIFDQPMVALEVLSESRRLSHLRIIPKTAGQFRWLGTKTLSFKPDERFPFGAEITATIPAGTSSLDGHILPQDNSWKFTTMLPRLIRHYPSNNQKWIGLDEEIILIFNQTVDKNDAEDFISILGISQDENEELLEFSIKTPSKKELEQHDIDASFGEVLFVNPRKALQMNHTYFVELRAGLHGKEGLLGMEKSIVFRFETITDFRFLGLEKKEDVYPSGPLKLVFSNPVTDKEAVSKIQFEPSVEIPEYYFEREWGDDEIWLWLPFEPETDYRLTIPADLMDEFGSPLGEEYVLDFNTSSYRPSLSMTTGIGLLESYGDKRYPVSGVNVDEIDFSGARIRKEDVIPLLNEEKLFWSNEKITKKDFFLVERPLKTYLPRNRREIFPLDLKELLPEKYGILFIQLDTRTESKWDRYLKACLQVTDMGISAKFSPLNNLVWVTELKTGLPVKDAQVEIRDDWNNVKWKGRTDEKGTVITPGWKKLGITQRESWQKPEQWIFVERGDNIAFLSSEWGTGIYPYQFGINYDWDPQPEKVEGYIYTDRGIYRAGEAVHVKGILRSREEGSWQLLKNKKITCQVIDSLSKKVFEEPFQLDDFSSFSFDFSTDLESPLGYYQIKTVIPGDSKKDKEKILYSSFRIEAFRPAEFEVLLKSSRDQYIFGENYDAEILARYMFGGAMSDQKVTWHFRLNPSSFRPPGHKGYVFGNEMERWQRYREQEESRLIASGESVLDDSGRIQVHAKLIPEQESDSVSASLEATVQGPSRRSVSSRIQTIVHRGEYYIGLRPSTTFLEKGETLAVQIISVDPDGSLFPRQKLKVQEIKRIWHSVKKAEVGGRFRWVTEQKDILLSDHSIVTDENPVSITFKPDESGFYILKADGKDKKGNSISTTTSFYVTGSDYTPWERSDEDTIELIPDNTVYYPGETAKILVKSPYEKARALVTIEREHILESRIIELVGSSSQIDIPVKSDYLPNVFVSILLVQGRIQTEELDENQDLGKPSFKIGYAHLKVDPSEKRLSIDIKKKKDKYQPGDTVDIHFKVEDWKEKGALSSISVAVVDLGVLSLIGFQTPDPFSHFNQEKSLSVQTSEVRQHLVGWRKYGEKGDDVGGGAGERASMMPSMQEIELRGDFRFTAYWNPSLLTDENGEAHVSFTLPDNLTTFKIMAVAQTEDSRFGRSESNFRVSKPLLLQAALPRFARVGDRFEGGIVVQNHSDQNGKVIVSCESEGILMTTEKNTQSVLLEPGEGKEVLFGFLVEKPGAAMFAFRARMNEETDGLEIAIPLSLPRPSETVAFSDSGETSKEEKIIIPANVFGSETSLEISVSASAMAGLKGDIKYLDDYPYLCLEQRISAILPFILSEDIIADFKLSELSKKEIREKVVKSIKEILAFQKENGGFSIWPDSAYDSPYLTCYAAFALASAKMYGYEIDGQRINELTDYLTNLVKGRLNVSNYPYNDRIWMTTKAFALYSLAILGQPLPSFAEKLYQERNLLSLFGQTYLLKALFHGRGALSAQTNLTQELLNKVKMTAVHAHFEDDEGREGRWIYSSNMRTTALILQSLLETGSQHSFIPMVARWLVDRKKARAWHTTQDSFYVFYALNDYYKKYEYIDPDFRIEISLANKLLLKEYFKEDRKKIIRKMTSLKDFSPGKTVPIKFKKKGEGTFYYDSRMTYVPKKSLTAVDEGFTVIKTLSTLTGARIDSIHAGDLVLVTLEIAVPQESLYVVVNDPLPAGLEAVNPTFATESEEQTDLMRRLSQTNNRWYRWYGFSHIEMHDDRVLLFADYLPPGIHQHRYLARALIFGDFHSPGTKIEEMYSPEIFGRSSELAVSIVR